MRGYALARGQPWFILSAKHGLLNPEQRIEPYDEFGLSEGQCMDITQSLASKGVTEVEIIAGQKYTEPLVECLTEYGIDYTILCDGMSIGERMKRLMILTRKQHNESLC